MNTLPRIEPSEYPTFLKVSSLVYPELHYEKNKLSGNNPAAPRLFRLRGDGDYWRDQTGINPIIIHIKNPTWFIEGEGGGTLKSLAERLDYPPEYDTNEPEPLNISKADTGLEERQRKLLKEEWESEKGRFPDEPEETLNESLKQSLEGSDTLKNLFAEWNPTLQTALKKIAEGHNVTFETALAAFLGMTSIAIGGSKIIRSGRWTKKAILWIAFHAPSGKAKSPLFRDCGRTILADKNTELSSKYEEQKREFETWRSEAKESRGEQPEVTRKLIWTTYTNLEALTQAHLENPTGIAFISDVLSAFISGRNQYKGGKGDDTGKLLEIWNGHEINNLTIKDYRNIPSVFVPIIGGIQTELLTKIFNPEDLANGFVSRFLLCPFRHPRPPIIDSERKIIRANISDNECHSVKNIIEKLLQHREEEKEFTFEPEAENILYECHDALTVEINKNVQEMESSFQKLKTYSLRISLLLHCIKGEAGEVTTETTLDAIELINWFSENMKAAFYSTYASSRDKNLKKILERLRQAPHPLTVKDLYTAFRKSFDGYDPIKGILNKLLRTGLIEEIEGRTVKYFAKPFL